MLDCALSPARQPQSQQSQRRVVRPRKSEGMGVGVGAARKFSLEERERPGYAGVLAPQPRRTKQRRPHTADGESDVRNILDGGY